MCKLANGFLSVGMLLLAAALDAGAQTLSEMPLSTYGDSLTLQSLAVNATNRKLSQLSYETLGKYLQLAYSRDLLKQEAGASGSTYTVKGSLFAIGGLLNGDFNELSTQQGSYFTRNFVIELGAKTQEQAKLSDGVGGFTFALVNKRDPLSNFTKDGPAMQERAVLSISQARVKLFKKFDKMPNGAQFKAAYRAAAEQDGTNGIANQLRFLQANGIDGDKLAEYTFGMVADSLKQGLLITAFGHGNTDFASSRALTQSDLGLQLLWGLPNCTAAGQARPWDLNIKAYYAWRPDTAVLERQRNLDRTSFMATLGVNKVLISGTETEKPFLEFSLDAGYERRTGTLYDEEDRDRPYGQAVVRARITDQVWVPLTVQLDLKHGKALGFLNVVWNLTP
jgi:hypothetical protein